MIKISRKKKKRKVSIIHVIKYHEIDLFLKAKQARFIHELRVLNDEIYRTFSVLCHGSAIVDI